MSQEAFLAEYTQPGPFTAIGRFAAVIGALPGDPAVLAGLVQGLLIHEGLTQAYGVSLPAERVATEREIHGAAAMLRRAVSIDATAITVARAPERRVACVCRHFATLFVAFMRCKGVPARARCGFADYFAPGKHVDHWVGEYWRAKDGRWVLVDAQIDETQRHLFRLDFDPMDVPRDRFLVAGDAWRACRTGMDPMSFGVAGTEMWGLVEVYGDLFQDLAALQNIELLPWGWYGLATDERGMAETVLIDALAEISSQADVGAITALRRFVAEDPRLRPPEDRVTEIMAAEAAE